MKMNFLKLYSCWPHTLWHQDNLINFTWDLSRPGKNKYFQKVMVSLLQIMLPQALLKTQKSEAAHCIFIPQMFKEPQ